MASAVSAELWYAALASQHGVIVEVNDVERAKHRLYNIRRELNDKDLESISIEIPQGSVNQLWLVKKGSTGAPQGS